jgi:hypothetical protein
MSRDIDVNAPGVVVMHSGGIDSLAALYAVLRDSDRPVHAHHIRVKWELRVKQEYAAILRQWEWLNAHVRPFTTSVSVDPRSFKATNESDEMIILPEAARVLVSLGPEFGRVMTGRCSEEAGPDGDFDSAHEGFEEIAGVPYRQARLFDPTRDWSKRAKFDLLPEGIRHTAWGCRGSFTADYRPCGACITCRRYQSLGIFESTHQ